jgi:hypothetical protein
MPDGRPSDGIAPRKARLARALAWLAASMLALAQAGLWLRIEPVATWSYDLSWWSAILLADAAVFLRTGSSIALSRPRAFLSLVLWSGAYWLLYECANLRLQNWYYVGIPGDAWTRTVGVFVSFATVLPGVLEIHALLSSLRRDPSSTRESRPIGRATRTALYLAGAACLVLPLAFPQTAYPLIWGAAFLLLEPWLASRDERSLLARFSSGDRGPLARMILAGLVCGAMWETWNWSSPAKWIYTVPLFEEGKLFEMPYLGFLGFVPFALGCHSFARALVAAGWIPEWEGEAPPTHGPRVRRFFGSAAGALAFSAVAIAAVNLQTIRATRPRVEEIPGLSARIGDRLSSAGIRSLEDLVQAAGRGYPGVDLTGTSPAQRERWVEAARLMRVRGLGRRGLAWLAGAGVETVAELASRNPTALHAEIVRTQSGPQPEPTPAEVRVWVRGAREMAR